MDSDDAFSVHSTSTRPRLAIIDRSIASRVHVVRHFVINAHALIILPWLRSTARPERPAR